MQYSPEEILMGIVKTPMPYGKYKGTLLVNLPVHYLEWIQRNGFPKSKLGQQLETLYEIRLNGLNHLLEPLKNKKYG